jgi:uncharacterized protein
MKLLSNTLKGYWNRFKHFCVHSILHADDPPHKLALGIAVGIFVALLPLIGIQMVLSFALAWLLRANKAVGVALVWISNPFTMVPLFYPGYWLGCKILGRKPGGEWSELIRSERSPSAIMVEFAENLQDFAAPLFLGTFIVAAGLSLISYYVSLFLIRNYRLKRWGQLMPPSLTPEKAGDDEPSEPFPKDSTTENAA